MILLSDDIKDIYLIDKRVTTVHKDDVSYSTYHISFYYMNKKDVIYHHKKQPYNIWEQVYFRKDKSEVSINFGTDAGGVLVFIILFILAIVLALMYTAEIQ